MHKSRHPARDSSSRQSRNNFTPCARSRSHASRSSSGLITTAASKRRRLRATIASSHRRYTRPYPEIPTKATDGRPPSLPDPACPSEDHEQDQSFASILIYFYKRCNIFQFIKWTNPCRRPIGPLSVLRRLRGANPLRLS
jgi:hypothetical protein